jgi:dsRNA-specific ribonuclease
VYWPEGYLSHEKARIVSNARLCETALEYGLPKFILSKPFTGKKWRPTSVAKVLEPREERFRKMSTKTIADVVEALIGAGWRMGQSLTALAIAKVFLPEIDLPSLETARVQLFDAAPDAVSLPLDLYNLEELAGYSFVKKSLLIQAMSHSSDYTANASYERLEFLGDAIIETIVVDETFAYENELPHSLMHLYRAAVVNRDYFGFVALKWSIEQRTKDLKYDLVANTVKQEESKFSLPLWRFMRHDSPDICTEQAKVERRYALLQPDISHAIECGTIYPWTLLASLRANKFFSDVVESLIGAIWIDSGSLSACKKVLDRMGILPNLHRLIKDRVHVLHPREELCILARDRKVDYEVSSQKTDTGGDEWTCTVFVGDSRVIEVSQVGFEDEVRTKAAEAAIAVIKGGDWEDWGLDTLFA